MWTLIVDIGDIDEVSVIDAILGIEKKINIPHGTDVRYKVEPGTKHGTMIKIQGKGIPDIHFKNVGDMYINILVKIPSGVSLEERDILLKLKQSNNFK